MPNTEINQVDELLDYAIDREQDAHDFYMDLATRVDKPSMKQVFTQYASEELGHRRKLEGIKAGKTLLPSRKQVQDLKLADYLVDVDPEADLDYQETLILAMKREKAAFRLYSDLAKATDDPEVKLAFMALAQEEAKHKLRFEIEYDDQILQEN